MQPSSPFQDTRRAAEAARAEGRHEDALALFREALALDPADRWTRHDVAVCLKALGRDAEAAETYRGAVAGTPFVHSVRGLGEIARRAGRLEEALALFTAAAALNPADPYFRLDVATALERLGRRAEAEEAFAALLGAHPDFLPGLREAAAAATRRDDPSAALKHLDHAAALQPGDSSLLRLQAEALMRLGRPEEAETLLARLLARRPNTLSALVGLARAARLQGRGEVAEAHRQAAEARLLGHGPAEPGEEQALMDLAHLAREDGRHAAALALLGRLPEASPLRVHATALGGHVHRAAGDFPAAVAAFREAYVLSGEAAHLVEAAEDALRGGDSAASQALLDEAGNDAPGHPALLEALARRALIRDETGAALELFEKAASADPARLSAALGAARLLCALGRSEEGLARLATLEARFGPQGDIAVARIELLRQLGRTPEAEKALHKARGDLPAHFGLRFAAIAGAIEAGRFEEADTLIANPPPASRFEHGRLSFARSLLHAARLDFGPAVAEAEAAAELLPTDGWVRNRLVHACLLDLDMERAGTHLRALARLEAGANALRGKSANPSQSHYGQIFDEFRMDGEALGALRLARHLPQDRRPEALAPIVQAHPGNTAAAIALLLALRRAGRLDLPAAGKGAPIPPVIHQYWNDPEPPADLAPYLGSWRAAHPGFAYRLWTEETARLFLRSNCDGDVRAAFERAEEPAMKADLFRLALLACEGGLYADADDRCLAALTPHLDAGFLAYQEDLGSLGNNCLAARPGHPVILAALRDAVEAVNRGDGDILWLSTGPGLLTRAAASALAATPSLLGEMRILDRHRLGHHVAIHCLAAYKATERHWSRTAFGRAKSVRQAA